MHDGAEHARGVLLDADPKQHRQRRLPPLVDQLDERSSVHLEQRFVAAAEDDAHAVAATATEGEGVVARGVYLHAFAHATDQQEPTGTQRQKQRGTRAAARERGGEAGARGQCGESACGLDLVGEQWSRVCERWRRAPSAAH